MIALLDGNNFFASCERVFRPDLHKRPVAVLSNNDGCIIARSAEVRAMGIPMGAPYYQVKSILDEHQAVVFSSNFSLYGDMSARMMSLIDSSCPKYEVYSIDEAFIDFEGHQDPGSLAHRLRQKIWQSLGLPTSIGMSTTKTLAKVANRLAKKDPTYAGVCLLNQEDLIDDTLKKLEVGDLWGVGRRISARLNGFGIYTAYDLKNTDPRWMRKVFSVVGERIIYELNGLSCLEIDDVCPSKKSIQVTRSFSTSLCSFEEVRAAVASFATRLGEKVRKNGSRTSHVMVEIRTNHFRKDVAHYRNSVVVSLPWGIDDDIGLIKAATQGLERIFKPGFAYRKAGVMAMDLVPRDGNVQLDLFSPLPTENFKTTHLSTAMDSLNKRYGRGTVFSAACGKRIGAPKMTVRGSTEGKFRVSPAYTTNWKELPIALAR